VLDGSACGVLDGSVCGVLDGSVSGVLEGSEWGVAEGEGDGAGSSDPNAGNAQSAVAQARVIRCFCIDFIVVWNVGILVIISTSRAAYARTSLPKVTRSLPDSLA
jgi:hypothetical protein